MKFVGLTECFNESVALFEQLFPPSNRLNAPSETTTAYSTYSNYRVNLADQAVAQTDLATLVAAGYRDWQDEAVYAVAAERLAAALDAADSDPCMVKIERSQYCLGALRKREAASAPLSYFIQRHR